MNGILLMTYYQQSLLRGGTPLETMFHAASTRMRPLLMMSLSACIGAAARGDFHRYWEPGSTPAGHGHRRWHAGRPHHAAHCRTGPQSGLCRL